MPRARKGFISLVAGLVRGSGLLQARGKIMVSLLYLPNELTNR